MLYEGQYHTRRHLSVPLFNNTANWSSLLGWYSSAALYFLNYLLGINTLPCGDESVLQCTSICVDTDWMESKGNIPHSDPCSWSKVNQWREPKRLVHRLPTRFPVNYLNGKQIKAFYKNYQCTVWEQCDYEATTLKNVRSLLWFCKFRPWQLVLNGT